MKIKADIDRCVGAGQCVLMAPGLFTQDEEVGLVVVLNDEPTDEQREAAVAAELACPSRAITIEY